MIKRIFDVVSATLGLISLSPIMILIAVLIKCEDGGAIFYRCSRTGRSNVPFKIIKFRSMEEGADKSGNLFITKTDPKVTKVGAILRKTKLDELPQLFNILIGDMSVVGPRPDYKIYTDLFVGEELKILDVRPGLTDWASVWNSDQGGLIEQCEDPKSYYLEVIWPKKKELQLKYIREQSFWVDIKIIMLTAVVLLSKKEKSIAIRNSILQAQCEQATKRG